MKLFRSHRLVGTGPHSSYFLLQCTNAPLFQRPRNCQVSDGPLISYVETAVGPSRLQGCLKAPMDQYVIHVDQTILSWNIQQHSCSNVAGTQHRPKQRIFNCQNPLLVQKAVFGQDPGLQVTCQYPGDPTPCISSITLFSSGQVCQGKVTHFYWPCSTSVHFVLHQVCQTHFILCQGKNVLKFPQYPPQLLLLPGVQVITPALQYLSYHCLSIHPICPSLLVQGKWLHINWCVGCGGWWCRRTTLE